MLTPAQKSIVSSQSRYRVVNCGRRFGKTTMAVEEMKAFAISRESRISYIAPTYQQARDIAWQELLRSCKGIVIKANESRLELTVKNIKRGQSLISFRGWESIESMRGTKNDFVVLDEVAMYRHFWTYWSEVIRPTLTDTQGQALFLSTPKGFNHFYDLFNKEATDKDYKSFHFTTYDNPFLIKTEIDKAKAELTEDRFAQEYLADFRKTEGLVFKEFDRSIHLFDDSVKLPRFVEILAGIDFGFTNPTAVVHVAKDYDSRFWVIDEWYKTGRTEAQIAEYVKSCRFNKVYPDPENPSAIEVLSQAGINVQEVKKNKDSVQSGINRIRELFKSNRLFISNQCLNLIAELEAYSYPESKTNQSLQEKPVKENDHAIDAMRYCIMGNAYIFEDDESVQAESLLNRLRIQKNSPT